jgi:hypothetical protein
MYPIFRVIFFDYRHVGVQQFLPGRQRPSMPVFIKLVDLFKVKLRPISRVAFSAAIRFAHKLPKKQSRLLASQFLNEGLVKFSL